MSSPAEILKEQYGITTIEQLNEAIAELGFLDISLFCTERSSNNGKEFNIS